ncbi:DUF6194 family protein [Pontivivens insulae]|uniref:DUF6194 domain-containing protein n=1 Tax=Pontivivens insulae TaxID=1639689 RepID=A0A2R8AAK4_9RHOB|nr:DUF6194 family protein [Pontivivens insulae]RED13149.1 hypothetical protein DFR53_2284 [Pontivivens insulae]SPF29241.1 hypothetical protein POI8812_01548 [Pontivivens insulae]
MTPNLLIEAIRRRHPDLILTESWGEQALFLNPLGALKRGVYVATIKQKDGENDRASQIDRPGIWRLNVGVPPSRFEAEFGPRPARPAKGGVIGGDWDFTELNRLTPHPVYGWMGWLAILNPSESRWPQIAELIDAAHAKATIAARKRVAALT